MHKNGSCWRTLHNVGNLFIGLMVCCLCCLGGRCVRAEEQGSTKEEMAMRLQLERKRVALKQAESQLKEKKDKYLQMQALKRDGMVTGDELNAAYESYRNAVVAYINAQISLEETLVGFLNDATYLVVVRGDKWRSADGEDRLKLVLRNASNKTLAQLVEQAWKEHERDTSRAEVRALLESGDVRQSSGSIFKQEVESLLRIENIFVSIQWNNMMIGDPYEIIIPALQYGQEDSVEFKLQQEKVDDVVVQLTYLGRAENRRIYLQKKSIEDIVSMRSLQFAQQGQLGGSVAFDLELERLAEDVKTFALEVVNLPDQYRHWFQDDRQRQLSQVKFAKGRAVINLDLVVYVPEEMPKAELDQPIRFIAVVGDQKAMERLRNLRKEHKSGPITEEELANISIGYEELELTPRGAPELELSSANLYYEIRPDETVDIKFSVKNTGTVRLDNVRVLAEPPYEWESIVEPEVIKKIQPAEEVYIQIKVIPIEKVDVGKYEMTVQAKCEYEGEPVEALEKNVTIAVAGKTNLIGAIVLVVLLIGAILAVAIFTVRLSRR